MTELEEIEFEISPRCVACSGRGYFDQPVNEWCAMCGGSGSTATHNVKAYVFRKTLFPAPWLDGSFARYWWLKKDNDLP